MPTIYFLIIIIPSLKLLSFFLGPHITFCTHDTLSSKNSLSKQTNNTNYSLLQDLFSLYSFTAATNRKFNCLVQSKRLICFVQLQLFHRTAAVSLGCCHRQFQRLPHWDHS